jgi:NAD dependent epimerase/dehydratase
LVERLLEEGYRVRAFVWYNSFNSHGWIDTLPSKKKRDIEIFTGDIRDVDNVRDAVKGTDTVFHLAALIGIPYSYKSPNSYVDTNIKGTLNVLQAAREAGVSKVIHTSTSEVYGTAQYVPIDEKHPLQPQSPYAATKIGADTLAESFYKSFNLPVCIVRPFNTYGPRQSARAVVPTIIAQIASGCRTIKIGDITPTRDFNYVKDVCDGFVKIAESDHSIGKVINIGSNSEMSIKDILLLIKKIMASNVKFVTDKKRVRPEKSEVMRLWCDNSNIKKLTGFKPRYGIERGLKETIEWFKNPKNLRRYKEGVYNV